LPKGKYKVSLEQRSGTYTVAWEDLPEKKDLSSEERLDLACNGAIDELKGKALSRKSITLKGHPGRELIVAWATGKGIVHDRMYLVGQRLYHVMAAGEKWWVESSTSQRVLDSFEIIEE
jgi:hypothetical protein